VHPIPVRVFFRRLPQAGKFRLLGASGLRFYQLDRRTVIMSEASIHALSLAALLKQATSAPYICEPAEAPFSDYDWERLSQFCQSEPLYCDRLIQQLVITSRKGGFLNGNYCLITGLLYQTAEAVPVASLEIRFSAFLAGPEIYLQSLCSPFTWRNAYADWLTGSPAFVSSASCVWEAALIGPAHPLTKPAALAARCAGAAAKGDDRLFARLRRWLATHHRISWLRRVCAAALVK
jgi:hypothetical protein